MASYRFDVGTPSRLLRWPAAEAAGFTVIHLPIAPPRQFAPMLKKFRTHAGLGQQPLARLAAG